MHVSVSRDHISAGSRRLSVFSIRHVTSVRAHVITPHSSFVARRPSVAPGARCPHVKSHNSRLNVTPDKLVGGPARGPASGPGMIDTVGDETLDSTLDCCRLRAASAPSAIGERASRAQCGVNVRLGSLSMVLRPRHAACCMSVACRCMRHAGMRVCGSARSARAKRKKGRRPAAPLAPPPDRRDLHPLRLPGCPLPTRRRARLAHQAGRPSRRRASVVAAAAFSLSQWRRPMHAGITRLPMAPPSARGGGDRRGRVRRPEQLTQ